MRDPRVEALAQILVNYSTGVQPGETCVIQSEVVAEPLVQAVYEEVLKAGGLPIVQLSLSEQAPAFYKYANDEQLAWIPPTAQWVAENIDNRIVDHGRHQHARAQQRRPGQAGDGQHRAQAADGRVDAALAPPATTAGR